MRRLFDADFCDATSMLDRLLRPVSKAEDLDASDGVDAHGANEHGIVWMAHAPTAFR